MNSTKLSADNANGEKNKPKITAKRITGNIGEQIVTNYLKENGYIIPKRNYFSKYGEIDIIAEDRENIRFVEVKTRKEDSMRPGIDAVDNSKKRRILLTSQVYIKKAHCSLKAHYDVAEVTVIENGNNKEYELSYYADVF